MTPAIAIIIALIFMIMPAGAAIQAQPAVDNSSIQPNINLNTQATWSSYNSSMASNEYINAIGGQGYLNVQNGTGNYISLNTQDIRSPELQNDNLSTSSKWDTAGWGLNSASPFYGSDIQSGTSKGTVYVQLNESDSGGINGNTGVSIPLADYPSNNINYDYVTMAAQLSGPTQTGVSAGIQIEPNRADNVNPMLKYIYPGQTYYFSMNLNQIKAQEGSTENFNTTANGTTSLFAGAWITLPESANDYVYNFTVTAMAFTSYPIALGENATGQQIIQSSGNAQLSNFKPAVPMTIINSGYSENLTQPLNITANYTETQTPLSGNYIEQVEYTGKLGNLTAPDITFNQANISINQDIASKQIQVLEINGISYSSMMNTTGSNKTLTLLTVNPGSTYSVIDITDYTASQWLAISSPAGFFQNPTAWIEGGIFSALIVIVVFLGFKGLGKTLNGKESSKENHARILNGKKGR